jgi:hypothetical protein
LLAGQTPWGLAWQAGAAAPARLIRAEQLNALPDEERKAMAARAAADPDYGFAYHSYPLVSAYLERWSPGGPHDLLLEELNSGPVLEFIRAITGIPEIVKMDGQATLYAPGHFLRPHNDEESERGRRVAYVLGLTAVNGNRTGAAISISSALTGTSRSVPARASTASACSACRNGIASARSRPRPRLAATQSPAGPATASAWPGSGQPTPHRSKEKAAGDCSPAASFLNFGDEA